MGGNLTQDADAKVRGDAEFAAAFGSQAFGLKVKCDPGERLGLTGGYRFSDWLAAEVEIGATLNTVEPTGPFQGTHVAVVRNGVFANVPLLFNVRLQYPSRSRWTPFIGAGVGPTAAILDSDVLVAGATFTTFARVHVKEADVVLAYQGFAGLRYSLSDRMGVSLQYRYLVVDRPEWNEGFVRVAFGSVQTHALSLALDYHF